MTIKLLGRRCTSSARYQDNLFDDNAIPPNILVELGRENKEKNGIVEAYIYSYLRSKLEIIGDIIQYIEDSSPAELDIQFLIELFTKQPGLRRSMDKVYEILVYSLFQTLVEVLDVRVTVKTNENKRSIIAEFEDFTRLVLGIDLNHLYIQYPASIYRVGLTNAADRGLDMWANFGPAIQVKHVTLDSDVTADITNNITSDRIIIVCKDCYQHVIDTVISQLGLPIMGIVVESQLLAWYEKALRGEYSEEMGQILKEKILSQLAEEFPSQVDSVFEEFYNGRNYDKIELNGIWEN